MSVSTARPLGRVRVRRRREGRPAALLLLLVVAAPGIAGARQAPAGAAGRQASAAPARESAAAAEASKAPRLRVAVDEERRELVLELGPLELPAHATHHEVRQPAAQTGTIPVDGWIHGYRVEIVDGEGRPVPQAVLHHVNVISPDQRELFSQIMLRIAAAGQETAPAELPRLIGYRVREGQRLLVTAAFHNPTPGAYHGAVLRVRMPYTPADAWLRPVSGYPFYMDVMPPASVHSYDLPPGRSSRSWEASPAVPGRILGVGGHLHKYGVALRLEDVTAGELIWEARPIVDEDGDVIGIPVQRFFRTLGVPVRPDHVYRLTAIYDNPTGDTIPDGAMGTLGGLFIPTPGVEWPTADPDHPEYRLDVEIVTSPYYGHGAHAMAGEAEGGRVGERDGGRGEGAGHRDGGGHRHGSDVSGGSAPGH
ncbi:MAG TPA: hypothetical protein VF212_05060 [Longimicrobiales bacterium]